MHKPLVTVITPNYNCASLLPDCIQSVQAQSLEDWEHIIIDDASEDNSVLCIQELQATEKRLRLLTLKENSGPRVARNTGILAARGRYIAFLDSDDLWLPEKLLLQFEAMRATNIPINGVAYEVRTMQGQWLRTRNMPSAINYQRLLCTNLLSASTTMYDSQYFGIVENNCFAGDEDHHLWLTLLKKFGRPAQGINQVLTILRSRPDSRSANKIYAAKRRWHTYRQAQNLPLWQSAAYFICYALESLLHRIFNQLKKKQ